MGTALLGGGGGALGWDGQTPLAVTPSGLAIVAGAGLFARTDKTNKKLLLDSLASGASRDYSGFIPGLITAVANRYRFRNTHPSGKAIVTCLECELGTAPGGATGANCLQLTVAGSTSGSISVPMNTAANYFANAVGAPSPAASLGATPGGTSNSAEGRGFALAFIPTANIIATSVGVFTPNQGAGPTDPLCAGVGTFFELLDSSFNTLVSVEDFTAWPEGVWADVPMPVAVQLNQGTLYYAALRTPSLSVNADVFHQLTLNASGGAYTGATTPTSGFAGYRIPIASTDSTWAAAQAQMPFNYANLPVMRVSSVPLGALLVGDLLVSVQTLGTGPTTPGNDMGFRIEVAAG